MKFIHFNSNGSPDVLQLVQGEPPQPKRGEVLIKVGAAGINRPDILQRKGFYPPPVGASPILGLEVAGTIIECGPESSPWKVSDRVCALVTGGGYAEYCIAPSSQCLPIPQSLSMEEAAGVPEAFFTVWFNVFIRGNLMPGESLLIHGGSSGIGTTAIQLAQTLGSKVFVTAGTDLKCKACTSLGATGAINYRKDNFVTEVRRLNSNHGVDVILDMVGGDYFEKNLDLLSQEGRLVQIAFQKGETVNLSLRTLMSKGATVIGSTLRARSIEEKGAIAADLYKKVWPLLDSRQIHVVIDKVFPLEQAADAHRRMESYEHIGKIILKVEK
jgi:putative PIG3 family NAD(P)H quinone oxidoreductase